MTGFKLQRKIYIRLILFEWLCIILCITGGYFAYLTQETKRIVTDFAYKITINFKCSTGMVLLYEIFTTYED